MKRSFMIPLVLAGLAAGAIQGFSQAQSSQAQAPQAQAPQVQSPSAAPAAAQSASQSAAQPVPAAAEAAQTATAEQAGAEQPLKIPEIGEGYARPLFGELIQTLVLLNGADINDSKVADEYGRLVYCDLYQKNFGNDVAWNRVRSEIISRIQRKKEDFRVKYEIVSKFSLGRYDFRKQVFPLADKTGLRNVGTLSLFSPEDRNLGCSEGQNSLFPRNVALELKRPLTVEGFSVPQSRIEKMMVRMEEAGNTTRQVYGRIRVNVTDAGGISVSKGNLSQAVLKGEVVSVDFFLDPELTKPMGGVQLKY